jgi:hypothetical protein
MRPVSPFGGRIKEGGLEFQKKLNKKLTFFIYSCQIHTLHILPVAFSEGHSLPTAATLYTQLL